jgi:hypothetical protein
MEEEMEELYAEGLAIHGGPESCVDDPRGRGEALIGVRTLRRRSQRNRMNWKQMDGIATRWPPRIRIMRPFPAERFAAKT